MKVPKKLKRTDRVIAMYEAVHKIDEIIDYLKDERQIVMLQCQSCEGLFYPEEICSCKVKEEEPELLPCPFCNTSDGLSINSSSSDSEHWIDCTNCSASSSVEESIGRLTRKWNEVKR